MVLKTKKQKTRVSFAHGVFYLKKWIYFIQTQERSQNNTTKMFDEPIKMDLDDFMKNGLKKETGHVVVLGYTKYDQPIINTNYLPRGFLMDPLGRSCIRSIFRGASFVDAFEGYCIDVLLRDTEQFLRATKLY